MNRPWMPLYVADYLGDTGRLSTTEHGAYLLLIMEYWQSGGLPDDDQQLARVVRLTPAAWKKIRATIEGFFQDGWRHKRIDFELAKAADISSKRRASAQLKHSKSYANAPANAPANAEQLDTHARATSPSPSPSQSQERNTSLRSVRPRALLLSTDWDPGPEGRAYAQSKGFVDQKLETEIERFKNHAAANGRTQKDWPAAWRNWVTSPLQSVGNHARASPNGHAPRPGSREDRQEKTANAIAQLTEYIDAAADERRTSGAAREAPAGQLPFPKLARP